ncbi:hypothetical protein [Chryseobacterium paridis]|uniref:DUF4886 domain-containing protein n=1 Tax=Chryseobacterium paridis TaxID=2800328 RepID=A0ABS1FSA0_9FLAO|nr:hypothetical protein [Chryseobacterium paridis]MBK1895144.1 hypothetical protein [Chryseobacterium paridis]
MSAKKVLLCIFLGLGVFVFSQEKKILFIGNSLTYYYDMPKMLEKMLNEETGHSYKIIQVTFPGAQLQHQISAGVAKVRFAENAWDDVVVQHGTLGYYVPEEVEKNILPSIKTLQKYDTSGKAKFYLFSTWVDKQKYPFKNCYPKMLYSRKGEDQSEKYCSKEFQNRDEQKEYLENQYSLIAKETQIVKTKHSAMEYVFEKKYPYFNMWDDESHPSKIGSYFNACIFFKMFSNSSLKAIKENFGIYPETALIIRSFVEEKYSEF